MKQIFHTKIIVLNLAYINLFSLYYILFLSYKYLTCTIQHLHFSIQAVAPYLPLDRSRRIANLSSVSARLDFEGQSIYGGTMAAIEAMTRTWTHELGDCASQRSMPSARVRSSGVCTRRQEMTFG
ncbi:hypothetical protein I7I50_11909 [Histoplasma capsulatum G186AR]|uniref:Uncharacterized protein n=1 Tax=Ajellomyces capsulatus TaxID=5037 RepID=A0A8H8CRC1_AJECA|nr:hypothetical protein I7I52_11779 [Histoplasma capsulatum]QSS70318.1 hypothetical protein I7I50_11909 [Histoplasma capsulatum G186AR]